MRSWTERGGWDARSSSQGSLSACPWQKRSMSAPYHSLPGQRRLKPKPHVSYCRCVLTVTEHYKVRKRGGREKPGYDWRFIDEQCSPVLSAASRAAPPAPAGASRTLHQGGCPCLQLRAKENRPQKAERLAHLLLIACSLHS